MVCDFVDGNYKCFVHRTRHPTTACLLACLLGLKGSLFAFLVWTRRVKEKRREVAACANPIIGRWISTCIVNYQTSDRHRLLLLLRCCCCCCCCCDSRIESSPRSFSTLSQQSLEKPSSLVRFSMKRDVRSNSIPGIVYYYFALFFYEKKTRFSAAAAAIGVAGIRRKSARVDSTQTRIT